MLKVPHCCRQQVEFLNCDGFPLSRISLGPAASANGMGQYEMSKTKLVDWNTKCSAAGD